MAFPLHRPPGFPLLHDIPFNSLPNPRPLTHPASKPHQLEDVGSWGTDPSLARPLSALQLHPHGVQQPLSIGDLMGPHDVEEGRAQSIEGLALIGDLQGPTQCEEMKLKYITERGAKLRGGAQETQHHQSFTV